MPASVPHPPVSATPPHPIDHHDLTLRLAAATPADTCKGMFFNGLFMAVKRSGGEVELERLQRAAHGRKFVDFFNYAITDFLPLAWFSAELTAKSAAPEAIAEGIRSLGRQATDDFLATSVGKTLLLLSGNEPRRLMSSLASGYKTAVSYGTRTVTWTGPTSCVFSMRRDFMPPPYHEGVLAQVLTAVGGKDTRVVGRRVDVLDTDYDVFWRA
jgi:uncharacterized protein (TIGR02265 family)